MGMMMVKKCFSDRNTVVSIYMSMSKAAKQLAEDTSHPNSIGGGETVDIMENQNKSKNKIWMTWHEIFAIIIYEVVICF